MSNDKTASQRVKLSDADNHPRAALVDTLNQIASAHERIADTLDTAINAYKENLR